LVDFSGLGTVNGIQAMLVYGNPALQNFHGLEGVSSVNNYIWVYENPILNSLSGLQNISPNSFSELFLYDNPLLSFCELPNICIFISDPDNVVDIQSNASNCTSEAAVEAACLALPIELIEFSAQRTGSESVLLDWATASEYKNAYFEVERSTDGFNFSTIGMVAGKGTASMEQQYRFEDEMAEKTGIYYRLAQYDTDGKMTYSKMLFLEGSSDAYLLVPNPADQYISIKNLPTEHPLNVEIWDLTGIKVQEHLLNDSSNIPLGQLPNGLYYLVITHNYVPEHQLLIVQH
jgi:hypothetical protein